MGLARNMAHVFMIYKEYQFESTWALLCSPTSCSVLEPPLNHQIAEIDSQKYNPNGDTHDASLSFWGT